jgi:hypothetical protein
MLVLAIFTYGLRLMARTEHNSDMGLDDYVMACAVGLATADYVMGLKFVNATGGFHMARILQDGNIDGIAKALKATVISKCLWNWSTAFIKLSVGLSFLRIRGNSKKWRLILYGLISCIILTPFIQFIIIMTDCKPFSANWDLALRQPFGELFCYRKELTVKLVYVFVGM